MSVQSVSCVNPSEKYFDTTDSQTSPTKETVVVFDAAEDTGDKVELSTKKPSVGKKILAGGASFFVPGLGQAINGEGKKGLKQFAISLAGTGATYGGSLLAVAAKNSKVGKIAGIALAVAGAMTVAINGIHSVIDAVKNGGKE